MSGSMTTLSRPGATAFGRSEDRVDQLLDGQVDAVRSTSIVVPSVSVIRKSVPATRDAGPWLS